MCICTECLPVMGLYEVSNCRRIAVYRIYSRINYMLCSKWIIWVNPHFGCFLLLSPLLRNTRYIFFINCILLLLKTLKIKSYAHSLLIHFSDSLSFEVLFFIIKKIIIFVSRFVHTSLHIVQFLLVFIIHNIGISIKVIETKCGHTLIDTSFFSIYKQNLKKVQTTLKRTVFHIKAMLSWGKKSLNYRCTFIG